MTADKDNRREVRRLFTKINLSSLDSTRAGEESISAFKMYMVVEWSTEVL